MFKLYFPIIAFLILVLYAGYLYSLRWDFLPWGSSRRDGLFFLGFYFIVLPLMLMVSFLKRFWAVYNNNWFKSHNFFIYVVLIALPSVETYGSQISLAIGVIISFTVAVLIIFEHFNTTVLES